MNYFLFTILVVGFSGIVAQILLLRELLVSFYGNELTLGIILANWTVSEALGAFIVGKYIDKIKNKINLFVVLEIIFSLVLPLSIYLSRTFKNIIGIPSGEGVGITTIFYASFFIILPISFCHGALFSSGCSISRSIGKIYAWEIIGTIIGGIIATYLLLPLLNSLQIAFLVSSASLITCLFFYKRISCAVLKYVTLAGLILVIYSSSSGILNKIHGLSVARQFRPAEILEYRNSIYGNIAVTQKERQYTFFYNGIPIITAPYPDTTFVEELGHLPLLFHNAPLDVLIISSGAGGIINEVLKHPVKRIDYAELDPLIIEMLKKYPTALTKTELSDNRVNVINTDGRFFMRNTKDKYDIVLIGLSKPSDLSTNRLFTQEFFALVKKRLNREGILAFWLPGSLTYLSKDLKDINACILNGLKNNYECVRIIPGDYNIFLASGDKNIFKVSASLIAQKINQKNIQTKLLIPDYLNYRLDKRWIVWFQQSMQGSTVKTNHDLMPFAVFKMLIFWNRQFSPRLGAILEYFENLDLKKIALFVLVITILLFYIFNLKKTRAKLSIAYSIATTGFFGMLSSLMLIFGFQVFYGYLYHRIGILMSIFMAGIALGSIWMTSRLGKINRGLRLFMQLEAMIAIFSFILAGIIIKGRINFTMFFFISGLFLGLEFPLAGKIYLGKNGQIGLVSGLLYCADLMGGWVAGILAGMVFLPVLGILNTCVVIAIFKLSSLILLLATKRNIPSDNIQ